MKSLRLHKYSWLFDNLSYEEMIGMTEDFLASKVLQALLLLARRRDGGTVDSSFGAHAFRRLLFLSRIPHTDELTHKVAMWV